MANQTANLDAPYISQAQSQPEVVANSSFDVFDGALGSLLSPAMSDADYTLNTGATPDEVTNYMAYKFTGAITADRNIIIPLDPLSSTFNKKLFAVWNNATSPHTLTLKTASGTGVAVSYSATAAYTLLYCDGTNVVAVGATGGGGGGVTSFNTRTGVVVPVSGDYSEDEISFTDITTNNASTSKHGYLKKLPGDSTQFMNGVGNWAVPAGGGGGSGSEIEVQHTWVANPATVSTTPPVALGYQPVDSVNNGGVLSNRTPAADGDPIAWKLTTSATAASFHEFGETTADILLTSIDAFQSLVGLGQTTGVRMWLGFAQDSGVGSIFQSDNPSGEALVMFRYSTGAGDTNFQCVTQNGVGVSQTVVDSGVAADTAFHTFKIKYDGVHGARFYIDGNLVATITTTIGSSTSYKYATQVHIDNVGAAADKNLAVAYLTYVELGTLSGGGTDTDTLAGCTDVSITSPTDGQVLTYSSMAGVWENQTPAPGSVPSGSPLHDFYVNDGARVGIGALGAYTLVAKISGRALKCVPTSWKIRIYRAVGSHFANIKILRTAVDDVSTVLDHTAVSFGGSFTPTMAAGINVSDAISLALDIDHDYYIYGFNDSGDTSFWGYKPAGIPGQTTGLEYIGAYYNDAGVDHTGDTSIGTGSWSTGSGNPWELAIAA